jgi:hypothetical protein
MTVASTTLMALLLTVSLPVLCLADTALWPKAHPGAPYAALKFYEKTCDCPSGLNSTASLGMCYNATDSTFTEVPCENTPFWGVVFAWWIGAGLLMGAASTTGWGVFREVSLLFSLLILKKDTPHDRQVGDEDIMMKNR